MAPVEPELLRCTRQQFELAVPLRTARDQWDTRSTLLVEVGDAAGSGRGEAAPLPGYSPDALEGVEQALRAITSAALRPALRLTQPAVICRAVDALVPGAFPAARFALETALLDRLGRQQGRPLWSLLRELLPPQAKAARAVPLSVLLPSSEPELALRMAAEQYALGARCFKLKIGPDRLQPEQAQLLGQLRSALGEFTLRLDANQSLRRSELAACFETLARYRPEFVEEPIAQPRATELASLSCAWALDESLQQLDAKQLESLLSAPGCRALVLKPTALGGFARCAALAARAWALGKAAVVSHVFEGELGWLACAHLAIALGPGAAAGLWPMARTPSSPDVVARGQLEPLSGFGLGGGA